MFSSAESVRFSGDRLSGVLPAGLPTDGRPRYRAILVLGETDEPDKFWRVIPMEVLQSLGLCVLEIPNIRDDPSVTVVGNNVGPTQLGLQAGEH